MALGWVLKELSLFPVLENPNFLRPNLNRPISFCHSMEPPNFLRPSLAPLSSLHLSQKPASSSIPSYSRQAPSIPT